MYGPADQVDAIGNRRKHAVERFLDRLGLTGKIEDQRVAAHDADLPRQDRRGHVLQAHLPHLLAEAGQHLVRDGERGLGRDVARCRTRAAGREHQTAAGGVDQFDERALDHGAVRRE